MMSSSLAITSVRAPTPSRSDTVSAGSRWSISKTLRTTTAVRRHRSIRGAERCDDLVDVDLVRRDQPIVMEHAADEDQAAEQVRSAEGGMEGDAGADAVTDDVRRSTDDGVDEVDRVLRQRLVRERSFDIGGMAVTTQIQSEHPKPCRQGLDIRLEEAGVDHAAVQQDERLAVAALVIPGLHVGKLYVG